VIANASERFANYAGGASESKSHPEFVVFAAIDCLVESAGVAH